MRRSLGLPIATLAAALALAALPGTALADGPKPTIESESVSNVTATDATLEARIDPGSGEDGTSLETTYEFFLELPWCGTVGPGGCEASGGVLVYKGVLPAGSTAQVVNVDLASAGHALSAGTTYGYRVVASNGAGTAYGGERAFTTPGSPTIESESVVHVGSTDATLQARIGTAGVEDGTVYQFQVVADPSEYLSEIVCPETSMWLHPWLSCGTPTPGALPIGLIPNFLVGPAASTPVFVDLAAAGMKLKPGTAYHYRVLAAKRVPSEDTLEWESPPVYGPDQTFTTLRETKAPAIESVSVSHLTSTDATLEAQIDTEGLPTFYQFHLTHSSCRACEDIAYEIPLPFGLLLGSFQSQSVSLDLNAAGVTLGPGFYEYSLSAINEAGETEAQGGSFEPPEPVAQPQGSQVTPGPVSEEPTVPIVPGRTPGHGAGAPAGRPAPPGVGSNAKGPAKHPLTKHHGKRKHRKHKPRRASAGGRR
jgi:hypothetical protein